MQVNNISLLLQTSLSGRAACRGCLAAVFPRHNAVLHAKSSKTLIAVALTPYLIFLGPSDSAAPGRSSSLPCPQRCVFASSNPLARKVTTCATRVYLNANLIPFHVRWCKGPVTPSLCFFHVLSPARKYWQLLLSFVSTADCLLLRFVQ